MKPKEEIENYLTPMKISRATNRIEEVKEYYNQDIGIKMLHETKFAEDGSELAAFMYD